MDSGKPQFQKVVGFGVLKVFAGEIRYDPIMGKPGDKHWAVARADVRDVTCERRMGAFNTLSFRTDARVFTASPLTDDDALTVVSLVRPDRLQSDPTLIGMQQRQADAAAKRVQADYQKQVAAWQKAQQPEQMVRTYKHNPEKEFQKDAARLARDGWVVQSQTSGGMKTESLGQMLTFGVGGARRVGEITVVYTRQRPPTPMPVPPQQSAPLAVAPIQGGMPQPQAAAPEQGGGSPQPDPMAQLEKLGELHQKGILTDEEFAAKKADILSRM